MCRIRYIDSLRGLLAINVVMCHFISIFYPEMYIYRNSGTALDLFATTPLSVLVNGDVAVQAFFVITGFMAAIKACKSQDIDLVDIMKNRYCRLMPMICGATLLTFCLMKANLTYNFQLAEYTRSEKFLNECFSFTPKLKNLLTNSFIKPFIYGGDYIGIFWTIPYEFFGFLVTFTICSIAQKNRTRRILYLVIASMFWLTGAKYYCPFMFGAILEDIYDKRGIDETILSKYYVKVITNRFFLIVIYIVGLYLACIPMSPGKMYAFLPSIGVTVYRGIGVTTCLWVIMNVNWIQRILEIFPLRWLGKISYGIYAFHWPIMLSFQAWLFLQIRRSHTYDFAAVFSFVIALVIICLVAFWATKFFDDWIAFRLNKVLSSNKVNPGGNRNVEL